MKAFTRNSNLDYVFNLQTNNISTCQHDNAYFAIINKENSTEGHCTYSRGRVVTRWPGSQEVGGSIPGCATKFVRCKNLAFNIGECVSRGSDTT